MTILPKPPKYPYRPITQLDRLSKALQVPLSELQAVAQVADSLYRKAKPISKSDGTVRQPFDALPRLKVVQRRIQSRLLERVDYPPYLTGSLKGRDARRNAQLHSAASVVVTEDIASFFPSTSYDLVRSIWTGFFRFSSEVAEVLARLTTKDGALPQGAVTSSYLANLAFWNSEPNLQQRFELKGIQYSRYVDDITISSRRALTSDELTWCIAQIYGMIRAKNMTAKRKKHEILRGHGRMFATKLMVNRRPALPPSERDAIRAAVFQLEQQTAVEKKMLNQVAGRVGRLAQMHPNEAEPLKRRLAKLRKQSP